MLEFVTGRVVRAEDDHVVLDAGGLGLRLRVRDGARFRGRVGKVATVPAWLDVTRGGASLFGFADPTERERFTVLLGIPGVGAVTALKLIPAWDALMAPKGGALPDVPGIGPAARARIARWLARRAGRPAAATPEAREVAGALVALGIPKLEARDRASRVLAAHPGAALEDLVREAVAGRSRRRA